MLKYQKKFPVRMCFVCKQRFAQKNLYRFWVKEGKIHFNLKFGRSTYLCQACLEAKNLTKAFLKVHKMEINEINLKENLLNVKG